MATFLLTTPQQKALAILPSVTGPLSLAGSLGVIYLVLRRKNVSSSKPAYDRLLVATSATDAICVAWWALGSLPVPKETGFYGARGNTQTCATAGFFNQLIMSSLLYNVGIVLYFLLSIRYDFNEKQFSKCVEPYIHYTAVLFPLITATAGVFLKVFNPVGYGNICFMGPYPLDCNVTPGVDCTRGESAHIVIWIFVILPGALFAVFYYIAIYLIYKTVRQQALRTMQASLNADRVRERIRAVATQSILYATFFLNAYFWSFLLVFLSAVKKDQASSLAHKPVYAVQIFSTLCFTTQGLVTFLIYVRPRYLRLRRAYPQKSRIRVLFMTMRVNHSDCDSSKMSRRPAKTEKNLMPEGEGGSSNFAIVTDEEICQQEVCNCVVDNSETPPEDPSAGGQILAYV